MSEPDLRITRGSDNVFRDLGFDEEEAENLKIRTYLMVSLKRHIREEGWTQEEAAAHLDETQPRISELMNGKIGRFSIDKLVNMHARVGLRVRIAVTPAE